MAQSLAPLKDIVFTEADDSIVIMLHDGKVIELFGDGLIQFKEGDEIHELPLEGVRD